MEKKLNAFTLAETMIVIVVLGIIATLTIPALVNKNKESVAKTKVRKAMAAYESALNKMIIENDLKDNGPLTSWAGNSGNGCANSTQYFKKVQGDGCIFKTSDGIWWNIENITRPVISFKEITAQNAATITANANSENDKTAFVLVGRFGNDGSLRVDDLAYETANSIEDANGNQSKAQVEKLYSLLGMKKAGGGSNVSPFTACKAQNAETCIVNGVEYTLMSLTSESYEYCIYDEETDTDNCNNESTATAGDYWVAMAYSSGIQAYDYDGSTCQFCIDHNYGDYYNAAKKYCSPGRLATLAELISLQKQGKIDNEETFFAYEEKDSSEVLGLDVGEVNVEVSKNGTAAMVCINKY